MREAFNDDELLSRFDIEEAMAEVSFGEQSEEQMERERISRSKFQKKGDGAKEEMSTDQLKELEHVNVPYDSLEAIFNNENLWIHKHHTDPALVSYDLEDMNAWDAFVEPRMKSSGMPVPFYQPKKLASKPPADRLRVMEHQVASFSSCRRCHIRPRSS